MSTKRNAKTQGMPKPKRLKQNGKHIHDASSHANILHHNNKIASWNRPPLPPINPNKDSFCIQNVDLDYITEFDQTKNQRAPVIRMYGITNDGNSVLLFIKNFMPYFYVPVWPNFNEKGLQAFGNALNIALKEAALKDRDLKRFIYDVRVVTKSSLWGYNFGKMSQFIKVTVAIPGLVSMSRRLLEGGLKMEGFGTHQFQSYESGLAFVLRYMIDNDIGGASWVEIPAGTYKIRPKNRTKNTHCQLCVEVSYDCVKPLSDRMDIAPLRVLSFDIECAGRKGVFPTPKQDPVIQISNVVKLSGQKDPIVKNIFTLNTCANIAGSHVLEHKTESQLLLAWIKFFIAVDPDIITGYNIVNFDLWYLIERAATLRLKSFPFLGRNGSKESTIRDVTFSSSAYGTRVNKEIKIEGRVQFDLLAIMRRDYKLRTYSLNAVSAHFLQKQKEDVHHSIITDLQNGTAETRRRLAVYCIKDAMLPILLLEKLMCLVNYIEMARVTGIPLGYILSRGQQIKVISQIFRKAKSKNIIIPARQKRPNSDESYEGATVIEPKRGYYTIPITTLDFASLYPSIMMAHNLCYTTMLSPNSLSKLKSDQYVRTPTGHYFIKKEVCCGVLPEILNDLLSSRKNAKRLMKIEKDPFKKAVLNGRQLALKVSANSVYGFTGAIVGRLPCLAISASVTAFGREMIDQTKENIEKKYTVKNGYNYNAEVVYGDTDSVMIKFGVDSVAESIKLGLEAAESVSKIFISPIKLEFEKVYFPYLLMNKKRYAGLYWTNPNKWDKMDTKGIETVRRDNCLLVGKVVTECLHQLLIKRDPASAIDYTKRMISDLLQNKLDMSLLVISKSLSKTADSAEYKSKQAHVEVAKRMKKRDPNSAPVVGDRVPYVVSAGRTGARLYEKAEDPLYVLENDLSIDASYYIGNQLSGPLTRLFTPIIGDKKVKSLFAGDHTRRIKKSSGGMMGGGIMRFAKKIRTCMNCKCPLKKNEKAVCSNCQNNTITLYLQSVEKVRTHEKLYSRVWTQCQRCTGSMHQEVLCTSRDCPIFYRRKKVQKDLKQAQDKLDQFDF